MAVDEMRASLEEARDKIQSFVDHPTDEGRKGLVQLLEQAVQKAHQAVFERGGREADKKGMGTTLEVVLVADAEAFVAHVGDSRTYLLRGGAAAQVTTDHTVAEVLVIEGKLTAEEARLSPLRTILVNAIGVSPDVGVELAHIKLRRGDKLLLCSDGLHDYFPSDAELARILHDGGGEPGLEKLVNLAKERGGHDNITGILVEVTGDGAPAEEGETDGTSTLESDTALATTEETPAELADTIDSPSRQMPVKAAAESDGEGDEDDADAVPQPIGDEPTSPADAEPKGS
jgi:serine/threonine protein phosphatase PrpC